MRFTVYADEQTSVMNIAVKSCGHIFAKNGRSINRPQGRSDWLLFYVAKESETFYLEDVVEAGAGSFVIFKPFERQKHIYLGDKTAEFYYVHFTAEDNSDFTQLKSSRIYSAKPRESICKLFEEIIDEVQLKQQCYEKICVFKLLEVISLLERGVINKSNPHNEYIKDIAYVMQNMHRECGSSYSLEEYAQMCNMSKFHFLRVFESITGSTPMAYRNKIRMECAKELLEDTDVPVGEIGASLGYASASYFCDAFKKETGISPIMFRRRAIKEL